MENGISAQLRSVISIVDRLRDINLQAYIQLPKIVVVGGQSSGKSSLIEQIVGLDFLPRGSGVVTRRPLEIRMIYEPTLNQSYALFEELPGKKLTDFKKVKEAIEELTDKICGKNKNIIDKAIILYVHSKNCPNLTVIDLPGLTRIAIEGQSEDIYKVTTEMIRKYMVDPTSIILCVVPANQDITNDEVLHMAMKIDVLGERTIGCITKIDIMDRGTDARSLLLNKGEVPLKMGYVGIKNRSQGDILQNKTVIDSIADPIYSSLPASCLGTGALITSLTKVLESNIVQFLPELMAQIKQKKIALHEIVKQYGKPLPKNEEEQHALLWSICNQFLGEFKKTLKGHITNLKCRQALTKNSAHIVDKFSAVLQEEFNAPLAEGLTNEKIYFSIVKYEGNNMPGFPSINSFYYLIDPLLKKLKAPLLHCLNEVCDIVVHVAEEIMEELSREFPNFREYIVQKILGLIEESKRRCSQFIESVIESEITYIYINNEEFYELLKADVEPTDKTNDLINKHPMILQLKKRVNVYYKLTVKNLRDTVPKNIKYIILEKAVKQIEFQLFQACMGDREKTKSWLKLNEKEMDDRQKKEKEYEIIVKAEQFLQTHSSFARVRIEDIKKKRGERQKQLKEIEEDKKKKASVRTAAKQESPIQNQKKPDIPKDSSKKVMNESIEAHKHHAPQKKTEIEPNQHDKKSTENHPNTKVQPSVQPNKNSLFTNLFGMGAAKPSNAEVARPKQPVKQQTVQDKYNQKAGQVSDKAVDQMFKNETFKKQSTKAVESGTSAAMQKQMGVSEQTGNMFGKGAGWLFKTEATQNYLKDQTKANLKQQVQIKK